MSNLGHHELKRKHIRFDETSSNSNSSNSDDDDDDDKNKCNANASATLNKTRTFFNKIKKLEDTHITSAAPSSLINISNNSVIKCLDVILIKNKSRKEKSFGFQLRGDETIKGKHFIEQVESGLAASRAGLRKCDKIVRVNGVCVSDFFISQLIQQIEYETSLNEIKLHLSVQREQVVDSGYHMGNASASDLNYDNNCDNGEEDDDDAYYANNQAIKYSLCMHCFDCLLWISKIVIHMLYITWEIYRVVFQRVFK